MLSKSELKIMAARTGLSLYQQEKDYLLKLFLFFYYRRVDDGIFKGGTCIKYLFGLDRFSEDLDFNLKDASPAAFKKQVESAMKDIGSLGIGWRFKKEEAFPDSFTCTIGFKGPLFVHKPFSENSFRIDAGKRLGTILKPEWQAIKSEYPETGPVFLVFAMSKEEILAEKIASIFSRKKGRDLYDVWFLLKAGIKLNRKLVGKKLEAAKLTMDYGGIVSKQSYEHDLSRLTNRTVPYEQIREEIRAALFG